MKKLKLLDTFSGIGGFSYAAEKLVGGFETTQFIEIDPYCQKVLNKHWPNVPIHDDIRTFTAEPFQYDAVCGGFPCQDISTAGQGKGITQTTRSGLFYELLRVIRMVRPKYVILENVAAILNNGLDIVLAELYEAGYDAEWATFPASLIGAAHQRDRWWLVAYSESFRGDGRQPNNNAKQGEEERNVGGCNSKKSTNTKSEGLERQDKTRLQGERLRSNSSRRSGSTTNSKSIYWNGDETQREHGGSRTQEIPRNRNSSQTSQVWKITEHRLNSNWREYVSEPCLRRGNDGLRDRTHRLRALGNSVVPQCAAIPLQRVKDFYEQLTTVDH